MKARKATRRKPQRVELDARELRAFLANVSKTCDETADLLRPMLAQAAGAPAAVGKDEDQIPRDVANMPPDLRARARQAAAMRIKELLGKAGEMGRRLDVLLEDHKDDVPRLDDLLIVAMVNGAAHLAEKAVAHYEAEFKAAPVSPLRCKALALHKAGKWPVAQPGAAQ